MTNHTDLSERGIARGIAVEQSDVFGFGKIIADAREEARLAERKAIAAWIREPGWPIANEALAAAIEAGLHHSEHTKGE